MRLMVHKSLYACLQIKLYYQTEAGRILPISALKEESTALSMCQERARQTNWEQGRGVPR